MKYIIRGALVFCALLAFIAAFSSFYTVDQQDRAVVLTNGAISGIGDPGFNMKKPFVDSVVEIPVTQQNKSYPKQQAYSRDQQVATMNISVSFSVPPAKVAELYSQFGSIDNFISRVLDRQIPQAMENVFGQYNAISAVQDRVKLVADLNSAVKKSLTAYPVYVESVQLENVSFSEAYDKSIEARMQAEVAVTKLQQDLQAARVTAQINVTNAQALADSELAQARAKAQATQLQGEAEAKAIKAKSDALNNVNGNFVDYIIATQWKGVLPTTMVPGQTVPFVKLRNSSN